MDHTPSDLASARDGHATPVDTGTGSRARGGWTRVEIARIEDLSDAVYGAGLEAMQMSRAPVTGSLAFAVRDGITYSSGNLEGRVALRGPLSESMITLGVGLRIPPGSRHWLKNVASGDFGVFLPGDEHDALYAPGALYAAVTLDAERLEAIAARAGLVIDARTLGGTGIRERCVSARGLAHLRAGFERAHAGGPMSPWHVAALGRSLLDAAVALLGRTPPTSVGRDNSSGHARVVARARAYVLENLDAPISIDAIAAAAVTSRRTLHRAFVEVLGETPWTYVRKLRLHRIRRDLASEAELACAVAVVANRWGIGELGRMSGWYRELFGELPSETLARQRWLLHMAE